jgi:hypothetical protein
MRASAHSSGTRLQPHARNARLQFNQIRLTVLDEFRGSAASTIGSSSSYWIPYHRFEREEERNGLTESFCDSFELFKRGSVPTPFDKAQEVDGHPGQFCELFLSFVQFSSYLPNVRTELFAEGYQILRCTGRKLGVLSLRVPPNGITGTCGSRTHPSRCSQ